MEKNRSSLSRRNIAMGLLGGAALGPPATEGMIRRVFAMGARSYPQGVQRLQGQATINGRPAQIGDIVSPGDAVATGPDSQIIFVSGRAVFLVRDDSHITFDSDAELILLEKMVGRRPPFVSQDWGYQPGSY